MQVSSFQANDSTYKSVQIKVAGFTYCFMQVTGKFEYVNVNKITGRAGRSLGKDFKNWEEAEKHYTSADMHMAIFSAQSVLK